MFVPGGALLMSLTKLQPVLTVTLPTGAKLRRYQYDCNGGFAGRVYHAVSLIKKAQKPTGGERGTAGYSDEKIKG